MVAADAIVMPSRWEGFGFVAIEAMRQGRPGYSSDRGALPEIIANGRTGIIVDIDRSRNLVDVLRSLDRVKLRYIGAAAKGLPDEVYGPTDEQSNSHTLRWHFK